MEIKVNFDDFDVKEINKDNNVKILMLKGEKGDKGDAGAGQNNVIEEVQVNGTALPVSDKTVNVEIPTNVSSFNNDSGYLIENDLQMVETTDVQSGSQITNATGYSRLNKIYGNTSQSGTPSPDNPVDINVVTGDIDITVSNEASTISQNFEISLGTIELCKIGNYKDYIYKKDGKWYISKTIKKTVLDGSENWNLSEINTSYSVTRFRTSSKISNNGINNLALFDKFINRDAGMSAGDYECGYYSNDYIYISINRTRLSSVSASSFKTWLSSNNIVVYSALSVPEITEITDTSLITQLNGIYNIRLFENETNFSITADELLPTLDITYAITNRDIYSKEEVDDIVNSSKEKIRDYYFNSIAQMKASDLKIGDIAIALGYSAINDGSGAMFEISNTPSSNNIVLDNGLYANYINDIMYNYYDEITYEKKRYYDTDCYITQIPLNDGFGNQIKPYVAYGNGKTPTEYARDNYTTLTINASSYITDMVDSSLSGVPIMIGNGEILRNHPMISSGVADNMLYVGIKADRSFSEYKVNETLAQTMLDDGCINVFDIYYKLIDNSTALDLSSVLVKGSNDIVTTPHPRQCIGIKSDKTIVILTCDGRFTDNVGLTSEQTQNILLEYGCVNAWNIDGGGSSSTTIKGSKINRNIDGNGTIDRLIPYTLNFKNTTVNKETAKIYSHIGIEKQNILSQLILNSVQYQNITSRDLDELIGNPIMAYGNGLSNTPYAPTKKAGYFINIPHSGSSNVEYKQLYNNQFFYDRDDNSGYTRRQINGTFTPWEKINGDSTKIYNTGGYIVISSNDYETIPFALTETLTIEGDTESVVSDKFTKFKINKIGYVKITVTADLIPKTADGDRYLRILKNGDMNEMIRQYCVVDQANGLTVQALINNDSLNNLYSFDFKGQENDTFIRYRALIETK